MEKYYIQQTKIFNLINTKMNNNALINEASTISLNIKDGLKEQGLFEDYSLINEDIFLKHLNKFIFEKISKESDMLITLSDADLFNIMESATKESIDVLFEKSLKENLSKLEEIYGKEIFKNRGRTKTNE